MTWLIHLNVYGGWLAAVCAGLASLLWLLRKAWITYRHVKAFFTSTAQKIDALDELAQGELRHNGGGSIKDHASQVPVLAKRIDALDQRLSDHLATCQPPVSVVVHQPSESSA